MMNMIIVLGSKESKMNKIIMKFFDSDTILTFTIGKSFMKTPNMTLKKF